MSILKEPLLEIWGVADGLNLGLFPAQNVLVFLVAENLITKSFAVNFYTVAEQ
jgi:hypothetical protein